MNGIDIEEWNPETDQFLSAKFQVPDTRDPKPGTRHPRPETGYPIQGYLAHKKRPLVGPCGRPVPRVLRWS